MEAIANKHLNSIILSFPYYHKEDGTERKQYLNKMMLINRYLKKIAELAKIPIPLTMYVARHSWASIAQSKMCLCRPSVLVWDMTMKKPHEFILHLFRLMSLIMLIIRF